MLASSISPEGKGLLLVLHEVQNTYFTIQSMFTSTKPSAVCFTSEAFVNFFLLSLFISC